VTRTTSFDVAIVGGGATGTGLVRDLAMRGLRCLLIEQGDLCHGTSGRFHGLLHSGARYVVNDFLAAEECRAENAVLRRIAPSCVEDTGGLFCWLRDDPEDYPPAFLDGCRRAGIPVEEVPATHVKKREPLLASDLARAFRVPDAVVNPFELADANADAAERLGSVVRRYTRLVGIAVEGGRVTGIETEDVRTGARQRVEVGMVVSAAGAWAGRVAALAGVDLQMSPGWGVMVVMNERLCQAVVNRCRMPGDGDIVVPIGTVCIAGTSDRTLDELDDYEIQRDEVVEIMRASAEMIPSLIGQRVLRVFAGARPLYDPSQDPSASRQLSRAHTVLDHAGAGVEGLVSIVGGKLTTYRLMAEQTADVVCAKLGVEEPCRTAEEPLPEPDPARAWHLGGRLEANEEERQGKDADLVCECELITRGTCERFLAERPDAGLEDMLRALRVGMGPCQGAFCSLRAAAVLGHVTGDAQGAMKSLTEFLEERLKGNRPILWGDQARQFRFNEVVYREVFALDHAPRN
jgi:glycerol-3-phosphate dehydrogenase